MIPQVQGYDYVFAGGEVWNKEVFDACPTVKMILRLGVGHDGINLADASNAGVPVTYMPGVNAQSVAEQTVALMLCASRQIPYMNRKMHEGDKKSAVFATNMLSGKTVGILGCGNIGKKVAAMLRGFHCSILAYDVYQDAAFAAENNVRYVDMRTLFKEADIISVHLPLLPDTRHCINRDTIRQMKPGVIIINTSRGGTIHSQDLADAIKSGYVAAAGLDVFEDEGGQKKAVGAVFAGFDNVIMTPHVAGATHECFEAMMDKAIDMVKAFKAGEDIPCLLNPDYRRKLICKE